MRKILLAVHGGATADGAAHVARLLRDRTGASLDIVAVLEPLPIMDYGYGPVYIPDADTEDALAEDLRVEVDGQLSRCGLAGCRFTVLRGPRVSSIAAAAVARSADLIVLGIGPHRLTDRALGGETSLHLAAQASTPVLAIPPQTRGLPQRILAAVDFSGASIGAARVVKSMLSGHERVEFAHATTAARIGRVVVGPSHARDAERRLTEFACQIGVPPGTHIHTSVLAGDPARALIDTAAQTGAELIALGSHGYTSWQRLLLGSVSSRVLRLAECAVLIYPARCARAASAAEVDADDAAHATVSS